MFVFFVHFVVEKDYRTNAQHICNVAESVNWQMKDADNRIRSCTVKTWNYKKMGYIYLTIAIIAEVAATSALKASEEFTRWIPTLIVIVGYGIAFYCLTLVLRTISVGTAYALWAGLGIVLVSLVSAVLFRQIPDLPAVIGMLLIVAGVVVIHLFSKTVAH